MYYIRYKTDKQEDAIAFFDDHTDAKNFALSLYDVGQKPIICIMENGSIFLEKGFILQ